MKREQVETANSFHQNNQTSSTIKPPRSPDKYSVSASQKKSRRNHVEYVNKMAAGSGIGSHNSNSQRDRMN